VIALIECLRRINRTDIIITMKGVVPSQDHQTLHDQGVEFIFGHGTHCRSSSSNC